MFSYEVQEVRRKEQIKKANKRLSRKIGIAGLVLTGCQFWFAQLIIWGLSIYHISSGIWPIWLIMEGVSSLLTGCTYLGMLQGIHRTRESDNEKLCCHRT